MWFLFCVCLVAIANVYYLRHKIRSSKISNNFAATEYLQSLLRQYFPQRSQKLNHVQVYYSERQTCTLDNVIYVNYLTKPAYLDFVLLHELAHILNRDLPKRSVVVHLYMTSSLILVYCYQLGWWQSYILFYLLGFIGTLYSWYGEFQADAFAARRIGSKSGESFLSDPDNCSQHVVSLFTHPPNGWRIARLLRTHQTMPIVPYSDFKQNKNAYVAAAGNN